MSTFGFMWIAERYRETLENAGLTNFEDVMNTQAGRCLRVLPDRENWYLDGMYLKKHRGRTWATRIVAAFGAACPPSPGRVEAENALALQSLGIDVMPLMAYGERLRAAGRLESFLLTEELEGYCELQEFIQRRFPPRNTPSPRSSPKVVGWDQRASGERRPTVIENDAEGAVSRRSLRDLVPPYGSPSSLLPAPCSLPALQRLIVQVADIARRFHAAGYNHRDFYCCHFLVKETSPGQCDVRLIDLQRVQRRRWFRRRWIVKDLAQLASMSPDDRVGRREKILFLRTYLGVRKLRPQDKRLVRDVLWKLSLIRRRARHKS